MRVKRDTPGWLSQSAYAAVVLTAAVVAFTMFIRPVRGIHTGLNQDGRTKFMDMVNGTAYRPFVYRTLLPTTVRIISRVTPDSVKRAATTFVEGHRSLRKNFQYLYWETSAAYEYGVASILFIACFAGFAHTATQLTLRLTPIPSTLGTRMLLATTSLLCLAPFFRFTCFPYDPPQLFLFALAMYLLLEVRLVPFVVTFVLCCINKETAVLLIPLFAIVGGQQRVPAKTYWGILAGLSVGFVVIKTTISWIFRSNPGSFVEVQVAHNFEWLTRGWDFAELAGFFVIVFLLSYHWRDKAPFLKWALLCTLPALMLPSPIWGFVNEWRIYYEVYPIGFALIADSVWRLNNLRPAVAAS